MSGISFAKICAGALASKYKDIISYAVAPAGGEPMLSAVILYLL